MSKRLYYVKIGEARSGLTTKYVVLACDPEKGIVVVSGMIGKALGYEHDEVYVHIGGAVAACRVATATKMLGVVLDNNINEYIPVEIGKGE